MHDCNLLRENDRLKIKLEAAEKAYMSLLYDYTELKEEKAKVEKAIKEVKDLLDFLIDHNYASKDSKQEKEEGYWSTITGRPYQRPKWWISQWPTAIWPFVWDYPYSPDWYPTTITLCNTTECRSVKLSCNDDSDDESAMRDDEDDGWENEEVRGAVEEHDSSCRVRSCKRAWGCRSNKWGQCSKLQQGRWRRTCWDNK